MSSNFPLTMSTMEAREVVERVRISSRNAAIAAIAAIAAADDAISSARHSSDFHVRYGEWIDRGPGPFAPSSAWLKWLRVHHIIRTLSRQVHGSA